MRKQILITLLALLIFAPRQLNCQEATARTIAVVEGRAPIIDGRIGPEEWQDASVFALANGGSVYLKHDGQLVYIGVRGVKAGWSHVYLSDGVSTDVSVIHASAALGKSVYRLNQDKLWQPANDFQWELRDTAISAETRKKMDDYLLT